MRKALFLVFFVGLTFTVAGCTSKPISGDIDRTGHACTACKKINMTSAGTGWCDHCNAGFVDGKKVSCKKCVRAVTGGAACDACTPKKK